MKKLVAYFSASGNTKKLAERIASMGEFDLYEITPTTSYSQEDLDWHNENSRSSVEMSDKSSRPEINKTLDTLEEYSVIYLGFPIWWYTAPTIINTFLEAYDFSDKIIVPFATSGSSGMEKVIDDLKGSGSPTTKWVEGKRFENNASDEEILEFISKIK